MQPLLHIYSGHQAQVGSLAWSPDGTRLVSGSADGSARVWQVSSGEPLVSYRGHQGRVYSVAWSPDGRWIASGGEDTTVQLGARRDAAVDVSGAQRLDSPCAGLVAR